jgi:hypothetical protein
MEFFHNMVGFPLTPCQSYDLVRQICPLLQKADVKASLLLFLNHFLYMDAFAINHLHEIHPAW